MKRFSFYQLRQARRVDADRESREGGGGRVDIEFGRTAQSENVKITSHNNWIWQMGGNAWALRELAIGHPRSSGAAALHAPYFLNLIASTHRLLPCASCALSLSLIHLQTIWSPPLSLYLSHLISLSTSLPFSLFHAFSFQSVFPFILFFSFP